MQAERTEGDSDGATSAPHFAEEAPPADARAWEEVQAGRFMPRRIRGSCKGRALG